MNAVTASLSRAALQVVANNRHNPSIAGIPSQTPPTPTGRPRRALSNPPPPPTTATTTLSTTYNQPQSPLFATLPPELRAQIFAYIVSDLTLPLIVSPPSSSPSSPARLSLHPDSPLRKPLLATRILSILLCCRKAYIEALPLLYGTATIKTFDPSVPVFLPAVWPASRFSLRSGGRGLEVEFTWNFTEAPRLELNKKVAGGGGSGGIQWGKKVDGEERHRKRQLQVYGKLNEAWVGVWAALARMKGLAVLRVRVEAEIARWPLWQERETMLLESIRDIGRDVGDVGPWEVGDFTLWVNWPTVAGGIAENLPFSVLPTRV